MKPIPQTLTAIMLSLLFSWSSVQAQSKWSKDYKTGIAWMKVTPVGQLIASTAKGLIGIDSETGGEQWTLVELKSAPENSYRTIPQSPFIELSPADGSNDILIIDPVPGKVIFNSREAGISRVTDRYFLYQSSKILVIGTSAGGKNTEMVMVDMGTGKKLWSKSGAYSFITGAKDLGNNELLVASAFFASRLNAMDGTEKWKTPIDPRTAGMSSFLGMLEGVAASKLSAEEVMAQFITTGYAPKIFMIAAQKKNESTKVDSKGNKIVTVSYSSVYMAFDTESGKHHWSSVVEMRFPLGVSYPTEKGLMVCSSSDGNINLLSYADGSRLLGKKGGGLSLKGAASGAVPLGDGRLLMISSQGKNSTLMMLDPNTGTMLFEKAAKIRGNVNYTEILSKAILVGSDEEVNLLNPTTGEWFSEKALEGGTGLIAYDDDFMYVFNTKDRLIYRSSLADPVTFQPLTSVPLEFQGRENPTGMTLYNDQISITSEQNLVLLDKKGIVVYQQYFPAPTLSDFKKALLIASAVRAAYYTAAFTTYSAAFGAASQSIEVKDSRSKATKEVTADISKAFGQASVAGVGYTSNYIKMAQQRFKATTQTRDYMLIMTSETKKDSKLLQVSLATGKVMTTIPLGTDKTPVYDVDLVEGKLFYLKGASQLECYQF